MNKKVLNHIEELKNFYNRTDVTIMAVTKFHPFKAITDAIDNGITMIGESRVQEARDKFKKGNLEGVEKHLIGPLQNNKINLALELFDVIHSVDRLELLLKLQEKFYQKEKIGRIYLDFHTAEDSKIGFIPNDLPKIIDVLNDCPNLDLEGIMTVAPVGILKDIAKPFEFINEKEICESFETLYSLRENLYKIYSKRFLHLSMGMSNDYPLAIKMGSTLLRLGTVLFGKREKSIEV